MFQLGSTGHLSFCEATNYFLGLGTLTADKASVVLPTTLEKKEIPYFTFNI